MIGDIDQSGFSEPSGVVFHPSRKTLFVVGDDAGNVYIAQDSGGIVKIEWSDK